MTSELNFDPERATEAHRAAFALITTVLSGAGGDVRATLQAFVDEYLDTTTTDPTPTIRTLADIIEVLAWNAAGALVRASGGVDSAMAVIQSAAIDQEIFMRDARGEEPL